MYERVLQHYQVSTFSALFAQLANIYADLGGKSNAGGSGLDQAADPLNLVGNN